MTRALAAYLDGLIDYAGLFPPAQLDMRAAVAEFARHSEAEEALLLNRFVCTAARLPELGAALVNYPGEPFEVSVVGTAVPEGATPESATEDDLKAIRSFHAEHEETALVAAYEVRAATDFAAHLRALLKLDDFEIFVEVPFDSNLEDRLHRLSETSFAAKGRTGGIQPGTHPKAADLARFLVECLDLGLPFKLTAGLHHPTPTHDPATGDAMHGFLNVGLAVALALQEDLSRPEVAAVLADPAIQNRLSEIDEETFLDVRDCFLGFGSCSIAEPLADLKSLALW